MTRRRLLALAFFTTPLVGVAVACSFPDVSFTNSTLDSGRAETGVPNEAASDAQGDVTLINPPDEAPVDLLNCTSCDCDNDGYWRDAGCDASGMDAANFKGFGDCDDSLAVYHPNQPGRYYTRIVDGGKNFDYDCSGQNEYGLPTPLMCAFDSVLGSLGPCNPENTEGFRAVTECGEVGELVKCKKTNLSCGTSSEGTAGTGTQGCH